MCSSDLILLYFKVNLVGTFSLSPPRPKYLVAALLIGMAAWIPAHEVFVLQNAVVPVPDVILRSNDQMRDAFAGCSLWWLVLLIAVVPAFCEELFFRGFLLKGLGASTRKWAAIIAAASIFAVFHFLLIKFVLTAGLGILLGYLCWQSRSIWPSIVAHAVHNATAVLITFWPAYPRMLGIADRKAMDHLPPHVIIGGVALVVLGVLLLRGDQAVTFISRGVPRRMIQGYRA